MKRFIVRSSLITGVAALGLWAYYAQAQWGNDPSAATTTETRTEITTPEGAPPPIQATPSTASAAFPKSTTNSTPSTGSDPFAASALSAQVLDSQASTSAPAVVPAAPQYGQDSQVQLAAAQSPASSGSNRNGSVLRSKPKTSSATSNSTTTTRLPAGGTPYNRLRNKAASSGYRPPTSSGPVPSQASTGYTPPSAGPPSGPANVATTSQVAAAPSALPAKTPVTRTAVVPSAAPQYDSASKPNAAPAPLPAAAAGAAPLSTTLPKPAARANAPQRSFAAANPTSASRDRSVQGTGRPGSKQLEGTQSPQLSLRKKAPKEIQVGKPAQFKIFVRNSGSTAAHDVRIVDQVPEGTSYLESKPSANVSNDSRVTWLLGTLEPGQEKSVTLQVMPETEGEIGSVASVEFRAEASARTVATRPQLKLDLSAPKRVMIGDKVAMTLQISNPGTGVATGITLYNSLPPQLRHEAGGELEFDFGDLAPRESRQIELTLTAAAAGQLVNTIEARDDGSLSAKAQVSMEVIAPQLKVAIEGPKRRFLERKAVYAVSISNDGTAPAKQVELMSHLPKGIKFVSANNAGHYDEGTHTVYWSLAELPEGESGSVELVTMPTESGNHKIVIEGKAEKNLSDKLEETIEVDGLAALVFEVVDVQDPVEVGGEVEYEIRLLNQGTKSAGNVLLSAQLPPGLRAVAADGPTRGSVEGGRVVFESLNRLAPKADTTFRIRAEGLQAGDQRIRIQLQSDDHRQPVTKEESTLIYSDR